MSIYSSKKANSERGIYRIEGAKFKKFSVFFIISVLLSSLFGSLAWGYLGSSPSALSLSAPAPDYLHLNGETSDIIEIDGYLYHLASISHGRRWISSDDDGLTWSYAYGDYYYTEYSSEIFMAYSCDYIYDNSTGYIYVAYHTPASGTDYRDLSLEIYTASSGLLTQIYDVDLVDSTGNSSLGNGATVQVTLLNHKPIVVFSAQYKYDNVTFDFGIFSFIADASLPTAWTQEYILDSSLGGYTNDLFYLYSAPVNSTAVLVAWASISVESPLFGLYLDVNNGFGSYFSMSSNTLKLTTDTNSIIMGYCNTASEFDQNKGDLAENFAFVYTDTSSCDLIFEAYEISSGTTIYTDTVYEGNSTHYPLEPNLCWAGWTFFMSFAIRDPADNPDSDWRETYIIERYPSHTYSDPLLMYHFDTVSSARLTFTMNDVIIDEEIKFIVGYYDTGWTESYFDIDGYGEYPETEKSYGIQISVWAVIGLAGLVMMFSGVLIPSYITTKEGLLDETTIKYWGFGILVLIIGYALVKTWLFGGFNG